MTGGGLEAVFMDNRATLSRFIRARGAGADTEDVLQELWIKLQTMPAQGPIANPLAYLHRMADNLIHDRYRSADRRRQREASWLGTEGGIISEVSEEPSAERVLIARDELARVDAALSKLSKRAQTIFRRFRLDKVGHRAIAIEQGISVSAVEKHIQRAYRAIMAEMEEKAAEDVTVQNNGRTRDAAD